jgi:hypothetical protein
VARDLGVFVRDPMREESIDRLAVSLDVIENKTLDELLALFVGRRRFFPVPARLADRAETVSSCPGTL